MKSLPVLLAGAVGLAAATSQLDIPTNSGDCNALCDITPDCQSTLFDTVTSHCYTFSCIVKDSQIPWQFIGYRKPGSTINCPEGYQIPEPGSQPPTTPPPAAEPEPTTKSCPPSESPDTHPTTLDTVVRPPSATPETKKTSDKSSPKTPAPTADPTSKDTDDDGDAEDTQNSTTPTNGPGGDDASDGSDTLPAAPDTVAGSAVARPVPALVLVSFALFFL